MFWWLGAGGGVPGPFCVHAGEAVSGILAAQIFTSGGASPDQLAAGEVFCPGVAKLGEVDLAGQVVAGGTSLNGDGQVVGEVFTSGLSEAQLACEDD